MLVDRPPFDVMRMGPGPIIWPGMPAVEGERGTSINGPSLIRVPEWVEDPRGAYYLYFAHHHGRDIRVAFADELQGPWTVYPGGVLSLEETAACGHIASPDLHVDYERSQLRMYFHGCAPEDPSDQVSFVATSSDGLRFVSMPDPLAPFYLRVFEHDGWFYGVAKRGNQSGVLLRSASAWDAFEVGPAIIARMRHAAVLKRGDMAWLFYSRIGDAPESVMAARLDLRGDWTAWRPEEAVVVVSPELPYEGADERVEPSRSGIAEGRRCELRDPAIYLEDDGIFLLYTVAGEQGIAIAELGLVV